MVHGAVDVLHCVYHVYTMCSACYLSIDTVITNITHPPDNTHMPARTQYTHPHNAHPPPNTKQITQDPFGNYVVQYVLELGNAESTSRVMRHLQGHYPELAQQKFSSNVVEKCLSLGPVEEREAAVKEIIVFPELGRLLQVCECAGDVGGMDTQRDVVGW